MDLMRSFRGRIDKIVSTPSHSRSSRRIGLGGGRVQAREWRGPYRPFAGEAVLDRGGAVFEVLFLGADGRAGGRGTAAQAADGGTV